jgi:hypothetical protein
MNLHPQTTIDQAKLIALREFPSDTKILWYVVKDVCANMEVQSAILGSALRGLGDSVGDVYVELDSAASDGTATYDASNTNEAILVMATYATASEGPAC